MLADLIAKLNILACISILALGVSVFIRKKLDPVRILFGINLFILGTGYSFRSFSARIAESLAYNFEHFFLTIVPFTIVLLFERLGKFQFSIKYKLFVSLSCFIISFGSFFDFHVTPLWLIIFFLYQMITFIYLLQCSFSSYKKAQGSFQKQHYLYLFMLLVSILIVTFADWVASRTFFGLRPSALLSFPILYIATIMINNSTFKTLKESLINLSLTVIKAIIFVFAIIALLKHKNLFFLIFIFFGYLILELTFKSIYQNISKMYRFNILGMIDELINFHNTQDTDLVTSIDSIRVLSINDFKDNEMQHIYNVIIKITEPMSFEQIQENYVFEEQGKGLLSLEEWESFFTYFNCDIFYYREDKGIVTVKLITHGHNDIISNSVGKLLALLVKRGSDENR